MHVGMVYLGGQKMSKSLGNLVFVGDLLKEHEPAAVRLSILSNHYRSHWEWDPGALDQAEERLALWRSAGEGEAAVEEVRKALRDDLDTQGAMAAIDAAARKGQGVSVAAALLGVYL